jgi:hypothetical protein
VLSIIHFESGGPSSWLLCAICQLGLGSDELGLSGCDSKDCVVCGHGLHGIFESLSVSRLFYVPASGVPSTALLTILSSVTIIWSTAKTSTIYTSSGKSSSYIRYHWLLAAVLQLALPPNLGRIRILCNDHVAGPNSHVLVGDAGEDDPDFLENSCAWPSFGVMFLSRRRNKASGCFGATVETDSVSEPRVRSEKGQLDACRNFCNKRTKRSCPMAPIQHELSCQ